MLTIPHRDRSYTGECCPTGRDMACRYAQPYVWFHRLSPAVNHIMSYGHREGEMYFRVSLSMPSTSSGTDLRQAQAPTFDRLKHRTSTSSSHTPTGRNYVKPNHIPPHILARMNNIFRGLIAGYGAKKLGGGCLGTVIVFVIIWMLLGQC
jgi:hypothetical protein